MATTDLGIPYFSLDDNVDLAAKFNAQADAINALLSPVVKDTGWLDFPFGLALHGDTAPRRPQMRVKGGEMRMRGSVVKTSGNFPTSSSVAIISPGNLPTQYRPPVPYDVMVSMRFVDTSARLSFNTDGSVNLVTGTVTSNVVVLDAVRYDLV